MFAQLAQLIAWFRSSASPDFVWASPTSFLDQARPAWEPGVVDWLSAHAPALRSDAAATVAVVSKAVSARRSGRAPEKLAALRSDPLAGPLPASWRSCFSRTTELTDLDARRRILSTNNLQHGSPYLAALALNWLLRADVRGKPWLALWPLSAAARCESESLKQALQVCRLMDLLAQWWDTVQAPGATRPTETRVCANANDAPSQPVPAANQLLTLKQAEMHFGLDENGRPLVPSSSLRKEFLQGRIAGTRTADSCNGRILLRRESLDQWTRRNAPNRNQVLSPSQASKANRAN